MFAKASCSALIFLLFIGEAKFNKKACSSQLGACSEQTEWWGYYNNVEATLLKNPKEYHEDVAKATLLKDPKKYHEDVAKAALIFSGVAYENNKGKVKQCLHDFTIKTYLSTTFKRGEISGFVGDYKGKYIVAAFEGTASNWQLLDEWNNLEHEN